MYKRQELFSTRMAGNVHHGALLVIDFAANLRKRVHHARHRFLVAGNRRCRDDDRIALVDLNGAMLAVSDTRQRLSLIHIS